MDFDSARRLFVLTGSKIRGKWGRCCGPLQLSRSIARCFFSGTVDPQKPQGASLVRGGVYFRVPLSTGWQAQELVEGLKQAGFRLVAADARADRSAYSFDWRGKWALLVGNEGSGLDPRLVPADRVAIPMPGGMESLNVGVAASILLYEPRRPRGGEGA